MQKNQFTKTVIDLGLLEPSNILHSSDDDGSTGTDSASARDYHTNKVSTLSVRQYLYDRDEQFIRLIVMHADCTLFKSEVQIQQSTYF